MKKWPVDRWFTMIYHVEKMVTAILETPMWPVSQVVPGCGVRESSNPQNVQSHALPPPTSSDGGIRKGELGPFIQSHGSLNVPIEHHPTIRYMVYNGYFFRWCPIFPKWDIYQPLNLNDDFQGAHHLKRELQVGSFGPSFSKKHMNMWCGRAWVATNYTFSRKGCSSEGDPSLCVPRWVSWSSPRTSSILSWLFLCRTAANKHQ